MVHKFKRSKKISQLRVEIVHTVQDFCKQNNLDYKKVWKMIYTEYGQIYNIWPSVWYQYGSKSKLDFLADYEELYGTLTKLNKLVNTLK